MKPIILLGLLIGGSMIADCCQAGRSGAQDSDMTGYNNKGVNNH